MCIYYEDKVDLTYNSQEHIFPATIGGIEKLSKGYVSDQANEYFSRLESTIITSSFIGLHKSFYGPGKRGSNKLGRMPISLISSENADNRPIAMVTLYNYWTMAFSICDAFNPYFNTTRAIFNDYKVRKEYEIEDYINSILIRNNA